MDQFLQTMQRDVPHLHDPEPPEWIRDDQVEEWREFTSRTYAQLMQELIACRPIKGVQAQQEPSDAAVAYPVDSPTPFHDAVWDALAQPVVQALREGAAAVRDQAFSMAEEEGSDALASAIARQRREVAEAEGKPGGDQGTRPRRIGFL